MGIFGKTRQNGDGWEWQDTKDRRSWKVKGSFGGYKLEAKPPSLPFGTIEAQIIEGLFVGLEA
jgi:hypothetical protein